MSTSNISTAINFISDYIAQKDPHGTLDPFNYYDLVSSYWAKESKETHDKFLSIVNDSFQTLDIDQVSKMLDEWLYPQSLDRIDLLKELDAPTTIIETATNYSNSLLDGSHSTHLLIAMLQTSSD